MYVNDPHGKYNYENIHLEEFGTHWDLSMFVILFVMK